MVTFSKLTDQTLDQYQTLAQKTYQDAFSHTTSRENMADYVEKTFNDTAVQEEIDNAETELYFVYDNHELAGYLKLNYGENQSSDDRPLNWVELQRLYLLESMQGRGLGKKMIAFAKERVVEMDKVALWLDVGEEHPDTQQFYQKQGFIFLGDRRSFWMGDDEQFVLSMYQTVSP